jgi:hypothetical protein
MPTQTITPTRILSPVLDDALYHALERRAETRWAQEQARRGSAEASSSRRSVSAAAVDLLRLGLRAASADLLQAHETVCVRRADGNAIYRFTILCPADLHVRLQQHPFALRTSVKALTEAALALALLLDVRKESLKKPRKPKATENNNPSRHAKS